MTVSETGVGPRLNLRQRLTWIAHLFKAVAYQHHRPLALRIGPLLSADSILIDVGAHSGQHAKLFAGLVPKGAVFAFEPGAYARSILKISMRLHRLTNVHVIGLGLSDRAAAETLHVPLKRRGTVGFGLSHLGASSDGRKTIAEDVQLTTPDLFVRENRLPRVDFIKVDIEERDGRRISCAGRQILSPVSARSFSLKLLSRH
jgi:FkbM family methyltransferase